jgi:hypothetical protein
LAGWVEGVPQTKIKTWSLGPKFGGASISYIRKARVGSGAPFGDEGCKSFVQVELLHGGMVFLLGIKIFDIFRFGLHGFDWEETALCANSLEHLAGGKGKHQWGKYVVFPNARQETTC